MRGLVTAAVALGICAAQDVCVAQGMEQPLLGLQGDAARGAAVVARQSSTCTLCHAGPFPNPHLQGTVGPDLQGVGGRLSPAGLRQRLVDASQANPNTVMPAFYKADGFNRPGAAWRGRSILSAQEIEDAVAFLATLR